MPTSASKSVSAVAAGVVAIVALSVVTDMILERMGVFPGQDAAAYVQWMLLLAFAYRSAYAVVGGYVTASFAPSSPAKHVLILGVLGTLLGTLGAAANWDKTSPSTTWYPLALVITSVPLVMIGGKMKR